MTTQKFSRERFHSGRLARQPLQKLALICREGFPQSRVSVTFPFEQHTNGGLDQFVVDGRRWFAEFPKNMAEMLRVERVSLRLLADRMDELIANLFIRRRKSFPNKWNPMFFGNWAERIMAAGTVKGPGAVGKHLLNEMLSAPEKNVRDMAMVLNNAAELFFYPVIAVFENLLKLVKDNHNILLALCRDFCRSLQHLIERCA